MHSEAVQPRQELLEATPRNPMKRCPRISSVELLRGWSDHSAGQPPQMRLAGARYRQLGNFSSLLRGANPPVTGFAWGNRARFFGVNYHIRHDVKENLRFGPESLGKAGLRHTQTPPFRLRGFIRAKAENPPTNVAAFVVSATNSCPPNRTYEPIL